VTLFLEEINRGTWLSKLRKFNVVMSPAGLSPYKDCIGKAKK
jgi:hypothetical protein